MNSLKTALAFSVLWLNFCSCAHAQLPAAGPPRDTLCLHPEYQANFKGDINKWLSDRIAYADSFTYETGIPDRIILSFIIDANGYIRDACVKKSSGNKRYDSSVLRVVSQMNDGAPLWYAGRINGEPVSTIFDLPVLICWQ